MTRHFLHGISGETSEFALISINYLKIVEVKKAAEHAIDSRKILKTNNRSAGLSLTKRFINAWFNAA